MMPDLPQPKFTDLTRVARDLVSAHAAVAEGIATHAEKHHAAMDEQRRRLEAERRLNNPIVNNRQ